MDERRKQDYKLFLTILILDEIVVPVELWIGKEFKRIELG